MIVTHSHVKPEDFILFEKRIICGHCVLEEMYASISALSSPQYGAPRSQIASGLGLSRFGWALTPGLHILCYLEVRNTSSLIDFGMTIQSAACF